MQCNAMQCNAMQCNAMQCNAMQCMHICIHACMCICIRICMCICIYVKSRTLLRGPHAAKQLQGVEGLEVGSGSNLDHSDLRRISLQHLKVHGQSCVRLQVPYKQVVTRISGVLLLVHGHLSSPSWVCAPEDGPSETAYLKEELERKSCAQRYLHRLCVDIINMCKYAYVYLCIYSEKSLRPFFSSDVMAKFGSIVPNCPKKPLPF